LADDASHLQGRFLPYARAAGERLRRDLPGDGDALEIAGAVPNDEKPNLPGFPSGVEPAADDRFPPLEGGEVADCRSLLGPFGHAPSSSSTLWGLCSAMIFAWIWLGTSS